MTAAVVAPVASNPLSKMPNLSSLRRKGASLLHSPNPSPGSLMTTAAVPQKKRKVSTDGSEPVSTSRKAGDSSPRKAPKAAKTTTLSTSAVAAKPPGKTGGKKPQNKYDPEVPMTKEELVVWRREQRRKRNRESAAASRQKQRDRISELEIEVAQWKAKFGAVMDRLALLEKQQRTGGAVVPLEAPAAPLLRIDSTRTTNGITQGNPRPTPVAGQGSPGSGTNKHHLIETISRPAVKITGDASSSALFLPDAAPSMMMMMQPVTPTGADVDHGSFIVDAPSAVPDECLSALPVDPTAATPEPILSAEDDLKAMVGAPVSPTGCDDAAEILDAIDLPDTSVADLPFLTAGDDELGDFLVDWL